MFSLGQMRPFQPAFIVIVLLSAAAPLVSLHAQTAKPSPAKAAPAPASPAPAAAPPAAAPPAAVSATPQVTTALFGDWTLRCTRPNGAAQTCEIEENISNQEHLVAQIAVGRLGKGQPLHLTILVPPSVSLGTSPALTSVHDGDPPLVTLTWRRCLPGGCFADINLPEDMLSRLRAMTEPARFTFPDATGRTIVLPFSPRGLPQALDALAKEDLG